MIADKDMPGLAMWMPWTDDLLTGIRTVDLQHKQLVHFANQLHAELNKPDPDPGVVGGILYSLVDYTYNHFVTEEELFQRAHYPEAAAHIDEHNAFTQAVAGLLRRHEKGESISHDALELLKHWLVHHIMKVDKAYVPFLISKNLR